MRTMVLILSLLGTARYKSRTTLTDRCSLTALSFAPVAPTSSTRQTHVVFSLVTKMTMAKHLIRFDTYVKRHPSLTAEEFHQ